MGMEVFWDHVSYPLGTPCFSENLFFRHTKAHFTLEKFLFFTDKYIHIVIYF